MMLKTPFRKIHLLNKLQRLILSTTLKLCKCNSYSKWQWCKNRWQLCKKCSWLNSRKWKRKIRFKYKELYKRHSKLHKNNRKLNNKYKKHWWTSYRSIPKHLDPRLHLVIIINHQIGIFMHLLTPLWHNLRQRHRRLKSRTHKHHKFTLMRVGTNLLNTKTNNNSSSNFRLDQFPDHRVSKSLLSNR